MRLTLALLGWSLDLCVTPDTDESCSLDGGYLGSDRIDPGPTDVHLGFTGGWESGDD